MRPIHRLPFFLKRVNSYSDEYACVCLFVIINIEYFFRRVKCIYCIINACANKKNKYQII